MVVFLSINSKSFGKCIPFSFISTNRSAYKGLVKQQIKYDLKTFFYLILDSLYKNKCDKDNSIFPFYPWISTYELFFFKFS